MRSPRLESGGRAQPEGTSAPTTTRAARRCSGQSCFRTYLPEPQCPPLVVHGSSPSPRFPVGIFNCSSSSPRPYPPTLPGISTSRHNRAMRRLPFPAVQDAHPQMVSSAGRTRSSSGSNSSPSPRNMALPLSSSSPNGMAGRSMSVPLLDQFIHGVPSPAKLHQQHQPARRGQVGHEVLSVMHRPPRLRMRPEAWAAVAEHKGGSGLGPGGGGEITGMR